MKIACESTQPPITEIIPTDSQPNQLENPPSETIHSIHMIGNLATVLIY